MKLADLVGKSWIIKDNNETVVLIGVNGVDVFKSSYDGVAGEIRADAVYKIKQSEWVENAISKVKGNYPMNIKVIEEYSSIEEAPYTKAVGYVRDMARVVLPDLFY